MTTSQFDLPLGETLKDAGMTLAAENRQDDLDAARHVAYIIALGHERSECCIDDVFSWFHKRGWVVHLGNAAGSVFRGPNWEFVRWTKSRRVSNHGRMIRVWRWVG